VQALDQTQDTTQKGPSGSSGPIGTRSIKFSSKLSGKGGNVAELAALHHAPAVAGSSAALNERDAIITTLRTQLEAANKACSSKEDECRRLTSALAAREQEIARSSKLITSATAKVNAGPSVELSSNQQQQQVAADVANARLANQLNGQIDFLNAELAKAQAQLAESADQVNRSQSYQMELQNRYAVLHPGTVFHRADLSVVCGLIGAGSWRRHGET
jgi:chromosome segregation ATPase